jgi:hypothetical protein
LFCKLATFYYSLWAYLVLGDRSGDFICEALLSSDLFDLLLLESYFSNENYFTGEID